MITQEVRRLGEELKTNGRAVTSFEALGITEYDQLAADLRATLEGTPQFQEEDGPDRTGVLMFRDDATREVGRRLMTPVIERLFAENPDAVANMGMYAINHYVEGNYMQPHQDYFDGTVVVATIAGERRFDVYEQGGDDVFERVDASYVLRAGSIMLLNGYQNLGHAIECTEGPSISIVCDTPAAVATS